jgi:hypothetical protein
MRTRRYRRSRKLRKRRRSKQRGGSKEFHFCNEFHYGDNILNLKFLYNISPILKEAGITIKYYYNPGYITNVDELERYVNPETMTLKPISEKPSDTVQLWMANDIGNVGRDRFDEYYNVFYKNILTILGLEDKGINTSIFQKEDYLQDIYNKLDSKFHNLDIIIINAEPKSSQLDYDKSKFDAMCVRLSGTYNIATTSPVNDSIKCTFKDGLKMQDIGAISTHAKYIIAVNSGPFTTCLNEATKNNVKKWIIFDKSTYSYKEIEPVYLKDLSEIDTIEKYLVEKTTSI